MGTKIKPCKYCEHTDPDYPFGNFCIVHHDHCDSTTGLTQQESAMLHQSWHRLESCLKRLQEDSRDGKLWLLSWQVGAMLRSFDYLPTPAKPRNSKPKNLYHKIFLGATEGAKNKVRFRKNQEMQKMLDVLEILKKLQEPSTHIPGTHPVLAKERIKGL